MQQPQICKCFLEINQNIQLNTLQVTTRSQGVTKHIQIE
jgi:hypothetical protein